MDFKKILSAFAFIMFIGIPAVFAQNVTVAQDFNVSLPGVGVTLVIKTTTTALDSFTIDTAGTSLTVTTAAISGKVVIESPIGIDIGGSYNSGNIALDVCDNTVGSRLTVVATATAAKTVTISPIGGRICSATAVNTSASSGAGGGGGGGAGGGSGGGSVATTPKTPAEQTAPGTGGGAATGTPDKKASTPGVKKQEEKEKGFADIAKLKAGDRQNIEKITNLMLAQYTFKMPSNRKYSPKAVTKGAFGLQMALAVGEKDCGAKDSYPGIAKCLKKGIEESIVDKKFSPKAKLKREEFYDMLLKALKVEFTKASVKNLKELCSDVSDKASLTTAKVYSTAKKLGLSSRYKGKKCQLSKPFSRIEAAKFAVRALNAKAKLAAEEAAAKATPVKATEPVKK